MSGAAFCLHFAPPQLYPKSKRIDQENLMSNNYSENNNIVYTLKPGDHQGGVDGDSVKFGGMERVVFLLMMAALTGDAILKFYSGVTDGAKTTALTFRYRLADGVQGAATGDSFGAWLTSAALTLTAATYANKMLLIEIEATEMTADHEFLTPEVSSAASAFNASIAMLGATKNRRLNVPSVIPS